MHQKIRFYLFITAFLLVTMITVYLIMNNNWYGAVSPVVLICMYLGLAIVSFGMREEMLKRFEK